MFGQGNTTNMFGSANSSASLLSGSPTNPATPTNASQQTTVRLDVQSLVPRSTANTNLQTTASNANLFPPAPQTVNSSPLVNIGTDQQASNTSSNRQSEESIFGPYTGRSLGTQQRQLRTQQPPKADKSGEKSDKRVDVPGKGDSKTSKAENPFGSPATSNPFASTKNATEASRTVTDKGFFGASTTPSQQQIPCTPSGSEPSSNTTSFGPNEMGATGGSQGAKTLFGSIQSKGPLTDVMYCNKPSDNLANSLQSAFAKKQEPSAANKLKATTTQAPQLDAQTVKYNAFPQKVSYGDSRDTFKIEQPPSNWVQTTKATPIPGTPVPPSMQAPTPLKPKQPSQQPKIEPEFRTVSTSEVIEEVTKDIQQGSQSKSKRDAEAEMIQLRDQHKERIIQLLKQEKRSLVLRDAANEDYERMTNQRISSLQRINSQLMAEKQKLQADNRQMDRRIQQLGVWPVQVKVVTPALPAYQVSFAHQELERSLEPFSPGRELIEKQHDISQKKQELRALTQETAQLEKRCAELEEKLKMKKVQQHRANNEIINIFDEEPEFKEFYIQKCVAPRKELEQKYRTLKEQVKNLPSRPSTRQRNQHDIVSRG